MTPFVTPNRRLRASAHRKVNRAVTAGTIFKLPCVVCGRLPSDGHHEDYAEPLEVTWLCPMHHRWRHSTGLTVAELQSLHAEGEARRLGVAA